MAKLLVGGAALPTNPCPLGFIKGTASTPLQITSNYTDLANRSYREVKVLADPAMAASHYIYVLLQTTATAADTSAGLNVLAKLSAGQVWTMTSFQQNSILIQNIWIDWSNSGDIAIPSISEA